MKKEFYLTIVFAAILMAACKEVPKEVRISAEQIEIEGKTANVIHADTSSILLVRDSLPNKDNGHYTVRTTLTLLLDSIFYTDQMEDSLTLKFFSTEGQELVTLIPTDSLMADTLISYLQSRIGNSIAINFEGKTSGKSICKLQEGGKTILAGFSFIYADPKITKQVNEYQKLVQNISVIVEEGRRNPERMKSMQGFIMLMALQEGFNRVEAMNSKLLRLKDRMSLVQYAKFKEAHDLMKTYDKELK